MSGKYDLYNSFSVCFNLLKIKYVDFDESFNQIDLITPRDSVNVFINLETVLNYITGVKDIDKKLLTEKDYEDVMVVDILNLAAHYKKFFTGNRLDTKVFLYMTDLTSNDFKEYKYNEDYRSYYLNKFNTNPKFTILADSIINKIVPESSMISEFLPNVYFINAKNIESSLVPYIVSKKYPNRKNVIITGDVYDTQYIFIPNFVTHFIRKSPLRSSITWTLYDYIKEIIKRDIDNNEFNLLKNISMYLSMLSVIGDKNRSIDSIRSVGALTVIKQLLTGISKNIINYDTKSIDIIKEVFPINVQDELANNYYQFDIKDKYDNLLENDIFNIESQIVDRYDKDSLIKLNNTKYYNHQLMLEALTS